MIRFMLRKQKQSRICLMFTFSEGHMAMRYCNIAWSTVMRSPFDIDEGHVMAFRPISELVRSWS